MLQLRLKSIVEVVRFKGREVSGQKWARKRRENEKLREKNFYKMLECIIVNNMRMDSNPTAPIVRKAD